MRSISTFLWTVRLAGVFSLLTGVASAASSLAAAENEYYEMATVPIPDGVVLEAGAIQHFGDHRLAVSTRLGDIYFVDGAYGK